MGPNSSRSPGTFLQVPELHRQGGSGTTAMLRLGGHGVILRRSLGISWDIYGMCMESSEEYDVHRMFMDVHGNIVYVYMIV